MKLEVIKSAQGYDNYRIIGEMTEELKNFFVEKGYRWSSYNKCYYPGTLEAKYENTSFTEELEKTFFSNNNNDINNKNKEKTVQLENLIAELREEIRLQKEKIKELESIIEEKNNNVDGIIPKYKSEITNVDTELEEQIANAIDNKDYEHLASLTTIPENEVQADILWDIEDETEIIITEEELEICKKIIPPNQYAYTLGLTQGEEGDFYKQKLKDIAKIAKQITTDDELVNNDGTHNVGFHYFVGNSDFYISEIKSDGLAFGYTILNGDIEMAEWGYQDLDEIINASQWIEMDYHVPEGMTIERMLEEKYPEYYKQESVVEIEVDNIIYSEEFIKKFGDWEKAQRLEKLKNSEIIRKPKNVIINGVHFDLQIENARNNKDSKTLRNIAKEIGKSIKGTYINKDLNVEVIISMGNIDEIKNHHILSSGHIEAMQYIPQIIENGIYITEEENQDKQKHPNISKYKYLISGIKIGETDYTCKSVIGVDKDGNHYYDQRLSEIEKGLLLDNLSQLMSRGKSEQSLNNYDKRLMRICQCPQSLYLDEKLKPSKETVEKVLNGKLWLEKDSNDIQILHDISNGTEKLIGEELSELLKETKTQDLNLKENIFHSGFNALHELNEKYAIEFEPAEEGKIEVNSEADKWIVKFYDISKVIPGDLIDKGRFIQSYYASSLLQNQNSTVGLNLGYGWSLDAETFNRAKELIKDFVSIDMSEIFSSKQNNNDEYSEFISKEPTFEELEEPFNNKPESKEQNQQINIQNDNSISHEDIPENVVDLSELFDRKLKNQTEIVKYIKSLADDVFLTYDNYKIGILSKDAKHIVYTNGTPYRSQKIRINNYLLNLEKVLENAKLKDVSISKNKEGIKEFYYFTVPVKIENGLYTLQFDCKKNSDIAIAKEQSSNKLTDSNITDGDINNIFEINQVDCYLYNLKERVVTRNIIQNDNQLTSKKEIKNIREQCREILQKSDNEITETDKLILAQYEGGGGINEENRTSAQVLNEFYTPNNLIEKVWNLVDAYNPNAVTVLEPTAGIGKFANNRQNNQFTMHELDETSARINKILHPEANIIQGAYQKQFLDENERAKNPDFIQPKYDIVIGNPPYGEYSGKYKNIEGKHHQRYEEYFIEKGLDALKDENSILAYVVPSGFLDSKNDKQKELIASKGQFVDAYRLPAGTFSTTDVGTDILIMRSWEKVRKEFDKDFTNDGHLITKEQAFKSFQRGNAELLSNGEHFKDHPEKILGEIKQRTNQFGKLVDVVVHHEGLSIQDELNKIDDFVSEIKKSNTYENQQESNIESIEELEVVEDESENQKQNFIFEKLSAAGIDVITDKDEFYETLENLEEINITLKMLNEESNYIQKISSENNSEHKVGQDTTSAISTPNKQNNIIFLNDSQEIYFNRLNKINTSNMSPSDFYHELRKTFDIDSVSQGSSYVCQQIGEDFYKLRISNHPVVVKNRTGSKTHQTSVVIKFVETKRRTNEKARVIEYVYNPETLNSEKMNGIISGINNWIKTGEFTDKNYDEYFVSQAEKVNGKLEIVSVDSELSNETKTQNFITQDGTIYGFAHENKIYLNPDIVSSEAALHEYTHLWDNYTKVTNPELWNKGKDIFKNTYLWEEIKNDPNYQDIANDEDLILSECHARVTGKIADQILDKILTENGELTKNTVIDWDKEVFEYISKEFSENEIDIKSLSEFVSQTMKNFMEGKKLDLSKNLQQEETPKITKEVIERKIMNVEDFSKLYGKKYDENEIPIWKATNWEGIINLSELNSEEIKYLNSSDNYIQADFGKWTHKILFMSGDIYSKIANYQEKIANKQYKLTSNEIDPGTELLLKQEIELYSKNINLLNSIKKDLVPIENIHLSLKSTMAEEFSIEHFDEEGNIVKLNLQESFILWAKNESYADMKDRKSIDFSTSNISREELNEKITWNDIVSYIDSESVKAERTSSYFKDNEEVKQLKSQRKKEADEKRQARSDIANKLFDKYIHEGLSEQIKKNLEYEYNQKFNSYVAPDYSKLPLFIDGMSSHKGSSSFKLYEQQIKGISFLCNKGNGLLAYDVGVGKTAAGIVATVNQIQSGRSKRPLILVPNQVYSKWYTDIKELFPNVQINDLFNLNEKSVAAFRDSENKNKLNIPENSISLITYEALSRMTFTDDSIKNALFEDFKNLLSIDFDGSEKENASAVEKIKEVIGYSSNVKDSNYFFFEDCGFDNITVDEAHNFKNLWTVPRPKTKGESNEYSGIPSGKPSARALKLYATTQLIQRNNDNRNVFLLTATPFTNSPLEVYSMLTYIGRERLHQAGLNSLRDFLNQFAQTKYELGVNSKGEIDTKQVMKNWKQLPALQSILTEYIDKVDGEEAGIIRPKKFTHVKPLDMTPLQKRMRECDEIRMSSMESSADTIVAMNNMRIAAVAPALANPFMYPGIQLPSINELVETSPKLSFVCNSIIDMYKNNSEKGQFLFLPLGKESHGIIKDYLVKHGIPKEAIEIINGDINNTPEKKEKITSKFNDPKEKLKIIIGGKNTSEGIDLNGNSFVMYNCSLGWNPSETIQAEGRIWRQGNHQGHVHIVYPLMNDSIDSVLYQKHDEKRSRINELWTYKGDFLNVEDINPEELKLELIKDPKKRAKLILDEETKDLKVDLSRIDLKIKNYDEIIENKISLGREKERYEESIAEYSKYIEDCKNRNEEVPIWYKSCLDRNKRQLKSANLKLDKINSKLEQLNIFDEESSVTYIRELNEQKKILIDKIESVKEKIPDIIQKLQIELAEQKLLEYPIDKQRKILETDILSNLRPMKEVEVEIKTERYEKMMNLKFHNKEISEEEYKIFVRAGYKLYEEYTKGKIDFKYLQTEVSGELPTIKDLPNNNTISFTWNQGELFFDEELIINDSSSIAYTNSQNRIDDVHITPEQITESEIKRDEIILPILNGQKSGMYKAFNDFAEHGVFDIIGSQIELENNVISKNGWAQLHAAMNIYRDKKFETFRYIFIEKATGEIKDQVAVAAYMPHRSLISPYENTLKEIISRAEQQDYLVAVAHNHPSGNIKPSDEDVYSTDKLMKSFTSNNGNSRFIGHIILDHNSFSYYDPQTGWQEGSKFEHTQDNLINKNYLLNDLYVDNTLQLHTIATKINDLNNWNDDFIPVIFTNSQNMVSGLKLYHKDYFNQSSEKIRNEFQFDGLNVGSIRAFPIITESFAKNNDMEQFEKKLMNHIKNNAFQDASIPKVISITDKFNIPVGKDYFDKINHDEIKINSTWNRFVTPELFSNKQDIKKTETIEW